MNSYNEFWEPVREYCKEKTNPTAYNMWFKDLQLIRLEADRAVIAADDFKLKILNPRYKDFVADAFYNVLGFEIEVEFVGKSIEESNNSEDDTSSSIAQEGYTFSNFIVGPSNKYAYTAAKRVAQTPGSIYNPLFIYGNSGLGKTHLLNAIIEQIKSDNNKANIVYTTSENFTNELIFSLQTKTPMEFHNKYRTCDALLVDDIQFIAGKASTEEEFFHTFDTLIKAGKQIVLTSDKPPNAIPKIEERLRTRFESGLHCDIQPPDFETRMAIIKNKANYLGFNISDDVSAFIAENIKSNIRQIGGAVKNIHAYCSFNDKEPTVEIAKEVLKDTLVTSLPTSVVIDNIIEKAAFTFGVTTEQVKSERRDANINEARQAAMHIIREITGLSQQAIGDVFGRNHSSVNNSLKKVSIKMSKDQKYKNLINEIIKNINE